MEKLTFYHCGRLGDIIYSLPTIAEARRQHVIQTGHSPWTVLALNLPKGDFHAIQELLLWQPYIDDVVNANEIDLPRGFVDLNLFRHNMQAGHIVNMHYQHVFNMNYEYKPWLYVPHKHPDTLQTPYAVVNVTQRYRDLFCDWGAEMAGYIYEGKRRRVKHVYFLGALDEWRAFKNQYHVATANQVSYMPTANLKIAAEIIAGAQYFSGTQSSMLAIRQALGLPYRFEQSPNHTDCNWYSPLETVINKRSRKLHFIVSATKKLFK